MGTDPSAPPAQRPNSMLLLDGRSLQIAGDQLVALQPNLVRSHAAAGYDVAIATTEREAIRLPMQEG